MSPPEAKAMREPSGDSEGSASDGLAAWALAAPAPPRPATPRIIAAADVSSTRRAPRPEFLFDMESAPKRSDKRPAQRPPRAGRASRAPLCGLVFCDERRHGYADRVNGRGGFVCNGSGFLRQGGDRISSVRLLSSSACPSSGPACRTLENTITPSLRRRGYLTAGIQNMATGTVKWFNA